MDERHIGSSFDDFLESQGTLAETTATACKRVIAWQIEQAMSEKALTKSGLADLMHTSRAAVDRLLDPNNTSISLNTMHKAANALGKKVNIQLV